MGGQPIASRAVDMRYRAAHERRGARAGSGVRCSAVTISFDLFSEGVLADPYPWYRWLRRSAPCCYSPERDIWVVSRYDDVVAVMRDHETFSSSQGVGFERRPTRDIVSADPPEHTRLRRLVNRQFLPRVIAALEPRVVAIVDELVDGMLEKGTVDLTADLAEPLPLIVIAELLGVPGERRADFKRWSDAMVAATGLVDDIEAATIRTNRQELTAFFREMAAQRRQHPAEDATDLISRLVQAHDADGLSEAELVSFCIVLLVAGNETTTNAISNGALAMLSHPDQWRTLIQNPHWVPPFIEEVLRFDAPIHGFFRTTEAPVEVAGTTIPREPKVLALFGSANRDEHHYPEADTFLAARNPADHIAFGSGIHACLGAPLARLEMAVVARTFLRRVGGMLPAGDTVRTRSPLFRGVTRLPVVLEPTSRAPRRA